MSNALDNLESQSSENAPDTRFSVRNIAVGSAVALLLAGGAVTFMYKDKLFGSAKSAEAEVTTFATNNTEKTAVDLNTSSSGSDATNTETTTVIETKTETSVPENNLEEPAKDGTPNPNPSTSNTLDTLNSSAATVPQPSDTTLPADEPDPTTLSVKDRIKAIEAKRAKSNKSDNATIKPSLKRTIKSTKNTKNDSE